MVKKSIYTGPLARKLAGYEKKPFKPDRKTLEKMGKALLKAVVSEIRKDIRKQKGLTGTTLLPESPKFTRSFDYKIVGDRTIEIVSSWPWIKPLFEGSPPFPMTWLTRQAGVDKVPIRQKDGTVVIRTTPLKLADAWVHPAISKHTFVQRGLKRGKQEALKILAEAMAEDLVGSK
jgi:hypothetical protein